MVLDQTVGQARCRRPSPCDALRVAIADEQPYVPIVAASARWGMLDQFLMTTLRVMEWRIAQHYLLADRLRSPPLPCETEPTGDLVAGRSGVWPYRYLSPPGDGAAESGLEPESTTSSFPNASSLAIFFMASYRLSNISR